jgi:hypothetical protein
MPLTHRFQKDRLVQTVNTIKPQKAIVSNLMPMSEKYIGVLNGNQKKTIKDNIMWHKLLKLLGIKTCPTCKLSTASKAKKK